MREFLTTLHSAPLFQGMEDAQILSMLHCLDATTHTYEKGAFILTHGERVAAFGLVLVGGVFVIQEDFWGNRNIIANIGAGEVFAESYACVKTVPLGVSVEAKADSTILFLDVQRVLTTCGSACDYHNSLIRNLVAMLAVKNLRMNEKLQHVTQRTTREKVLSFLLAESRRRGSAAFSIPFNRQQLADYLSVDRSAMSSELSRLRDEGVLLFEKNQFTLLEGIAGISPDTAAH
ncbi:MAG: Crp/Fnr family transcriptional regulator [Candidatus Limiplasma sp.]|nr:Crp/Fnr family transcriptional regulator [Candidatus Limiplasma sp.]